MTRRGILGWGAALGVLGALAASRAQPAAGTQSVLGPGLYVFQTRTRSSTCGDAERDGYVTSYLASLDGVPGSVEMTMELVNTAHFKTWPLKVSGERVSGSARIGSAADAPESQFEVTLAKDRFKGMGTRSYTSKVDGKPQRCRVEYDALLRRIDGG